VRTKHIPEFRLLALLLVFLFAPLAPIHAQQTATDSKPKTTLQGSAKPLQHAQFEQIRDYIRQGWKQLSRSMNECGSLVDTKVNEKPLLYLPNGAEVPESVRRAENSCGVRIAFLPRKIEKLGQISASDIPQQGLLYLPHPYVVPGGRFNEMYGWDSYFIIRGLLHDDQTEMAKGMVENFFFEIENYGALLNANRTYFLTRSQPPLLSSMIIDVYEAEKKSGNKDTVWLKRAYDHAVRDHALWIAEPHLAGTTGLSRYFDFGNGPVPEVGDDPHYYAEVTSYLLTHPGRGSEYLALQKSGSVAAGPVFEFRACAEARTDTSVQSCGPVEKLRLTADYYKGDRSMRESGFDISFRFGPFSGSTHHYAGVGLNSLLYKYEVDLGKMAKLLGQQEDARKWQQQADARKIAINKFLWDQKAGMFFDYNFLEGKRSDYNFATTFYPLWAGLATPEQARAVVASLKTFERPGGVVTSDRETGMQWDAPFGWAPVQWFAVEGLRRYHYGADADRLAQKFVSMVLENFLRDGTIREKYNLTTRSTDTATTAGYKANVIGFGWTNGVFLDFTSELSSADSKPANTRRPKRKERNESSSIRTGH
jgi:alpha,alpha-trehalase